MRVWLDDLREMPEDFDLHVYSAEEAIKVLSSGAVTFISFDHDLGLEKTGYDVAAWLEKAIFEGTLKQLPGYAIHSANPVGAKNILRALQKAEGFVRKE